MYLVDPQLPIRLREIREARGLSLRAAGRLTNYSHTYLWEIETGRKHPTPEVAAHLDDVLAAGGVLQKLVSKPSSPIDADATDRLVAIARGAARIDAVALDSFDALLAEQRRREDLVGAAQTISPVSHHLATLTTAIARAPSRLARETFGIAAQWAQFAGWLYLACEQYGRATRRLDRALEWATIVGDRDLVSTVLSFKGHQAWLQGQIGLMVTLTDAALREPGVYVGQVAYDLLQRARGSAVAGDVTAAVDDLAAAKDQIAASLEYNGEIRPWHYYRTAGFLDMEQGVVCSLLASHEIKWADRAVELIKAGIAALPAEQRQAEWVADYLCLQAQAQRRSGDVAGRNATLQELTAIAELTGSARLRRSLSASNAADA